MSTGTDVGLGIGVGGGVCLLAAVAIVAYLWGRRQKKRKLDAAREAQQPNTPYPGSPPSMQQQPYYLSQSEMGPWEHSGHPMGQPLMQQQSAYFGQGQQAPYQGAQPVFEVESPPMEKQASFSPHSPPLELMAEVPMHEVDTEPGRNPPTPIPTHAEAMGQRAI